MAMFRPNPTAGYQGYQPDIKAFCTPNIMSCYPLPHAARDTSHVFLFEFSGI